MKAIVKFIHSMQHGPENFVLTDEGDIDKFWGIEINDIGSGQYEFSQPNFIDWIFQVLQLEANGFETSKNNRLTPAAVQILNKDIEGKPRKKSWNFRNDVSMLSYLQGNIRPDISLAVHYTARF